MCEFADRGSRSPESVVASRTKQQKITWLKALIFTDRERGARGQYVLAEWLNDIVRTEGGCYTLPGTIHAYLDQVLEHPLVTSRVRYKGPGHLVEVLTHKGVRPIVEGAALLQPA